MLIGFDQVMPALVGTLVSFLTCMLLVLTQRWHGWLTYDTMVGVQKFHIAPTPRVGGISIMLGLLTAWLVNPSHGSPLGVVLLAGVPAFVFGLAEDLTKRVSVRNRLLATMASGLLAWYLTGYYINETEIWVLDSLLLSVPIAVMFTAFAVGGVANAINIIDGFNGLASGAVVLAAGCLGFIAWDVRDLQLALLCLQVCAVTLGFMGLNFPLGKIFLGDGGAYLLGFVLAWIAVMLPVRNPEVSAWCPLLACGYPIIETLFSMARRMRSRVAPGQPDREHLHNLIKFGIARRYFPHLGPRARNAIVSPFAWGYALVPSVLAFTFASSTFALVISMLLCTALYAVCYWKLAGLAQAEVSGFGYQDSARPLHPKPVRAMNVGAVQDVATVDQP